MDQSNKLRQIGQTLSERLPTSKRSVERLFYIVTLLAFAAFYIQLQDVRPDAAAIPRGLIYTSVLMLLWGWISLEFPNYKRYIPGYDPGSKKDAGSNEASELPNEKVRQEAGQQHGVNITEIQPIKLAKPPLAIGLYIISIPTIGFFTGSLVFMYFYILSERRTKPFIEKYITPFLWSCVGTIMLYIILIEILRSYFIFAFGILP